MDRMDEINDRLNDRDHFNGGRMIFDIRGTPTRYVSSFPTLNEKKSCKTKFTTIIQNYNKEIEIENMLRNQYHSLQHGASQSVYIPSSSSDLYRTIVPISSNYQKQPFEGLFKTQQFHTTENNFINSTVTQNTFHNCTRSVKNIQEQEREKEKEKEKEQEQKQDKRTKTR